MVSPARIMMDRESLQLSTVLWLGGQQTDYARVSRGLSNIDIPVRRVNDVPRLLAALKRLPAALCVVDLTNGVDGAQALRTIRADFPQSVPVALVDRNRTESVLEAFTDGAFDVLASPVAAADLAAIVRNAEEFVGLASEALGVTPAAQGATGVVALSESMRRLMDLVPRLGAARCHVLLCGEPGTGRETVATLLHEAGGRSRGRFVKVDCAGALLPELRTALFGSAHAPTSRPSGVDSQTGLFSDARGGTLYLEHLADMPLEVQARLARCLRQGDFARGNDVKVIAAVEPGVSDLVRDGAIREDLFQSLSLVRVEVPPLRERSGDIALLALRFLADICHREGCRRKTMTRSAMTLLGALPWQGNLPELRGLLERLAVMLPGGVVRLEDVLAHVSLNGSEPLASAGAASLREARQQFERDYIASTLRRHQGRMRDAARALGIQRTNLYRKVRLLKLSRQGRMPRACST